MVRNLLDQGHLERQKTVRRLRNLPQELKQPYDWAEFRRRARERSALVARRGVHHRAYLAAAAALVLVVLGLAAWMRLTRSQVTHPVANLTVDSGFSVRVDRRTDAAERWLVNLPSEPGVVRVGTRAVETGLEDRIAQLDDYLSTARIEGAQPAVLASAEQQRALLVKSLAQVRYAQILVAQAR